MTNKIDILRPTGDLESAYDFWSRRHPSHFCLAVELRGPLDAGRIAGAVEALADHHPLLGADVVLDGDDVALGHFVRHGRRPDVLVSDGPLDLAAVIGTELAAPFPRDRPTSRFRARIGRTAAADTWTVLFVVDHQIADGISTLRMVGDLVALLDGETLPEPADPVAREDLLAAVPAPPPAEPPASALPPAVVRPFDGAAPQVRLDALTSDETARLVRRCHDESATVNGAIVAACLRALADDVDFLRINVPVDLRPRVDADVAVGLYMGNANLVFEQPFSDDFWDVARSVSRQTRDGAAPPVLRAVSDSISGAMRAGMSEAELEPALVAGLGFELLVSNLGELAPSSGSVGVEAVWGPAVLVQMQGERMLGVTTANGRLRLVYVSHDPWPDVLGPLREAL